MFGAQSKQVSESCEFKLAFGTQKFSVFAIKFELQTQSFKCHYIYDNKNVYQI